MLPFLKPKQVASMIITKRKPDGQVQAEHSVDDEDHALHAAADDLIQAIHNKDTRGVSEALRSAFEILDAEPHEEGPHLNEDEENEED